MAKDTLLGFIGTGTISNALIRGFIRVNAPFRFIISPRNAEKAAALFSAFPDRIIIAKDNQEVADLADTVFVAVLPKNAKDVYTNVRFRSCHTIINLVMMPDPLITIPQWTGEVRNLAHIIPLAFVAELNGPIVLYPENPTVRNILEPLGSIVCVNNARDMRTMEQITGLEASFFSLLSEILSWCKKQELSDQLCLDFITALFIAMCEHSAKGNMDRTIELANEFTPGGLNWIGKETLIKADAIASWTDALNEIKALNER